MFPMSDSEPEYFYEICDPEKENDIYSVLISILKIPIYLQHSSHLLKLYSFRIEISVLLLHDDTIY